MHCSSLFVAQKRELEEIGPWIYYQLPLIANLWPGQIKNRSSGIRGDKPGDIVPHTEILLEPNLVGKRAEKIAWGRSHHIIICCAFIRRESSRKRC